MLGWGSSNTPAVQPPPGGGPPPVGGQLDPHATQPQHGGTPPPTQSSWNPMAWGKSTPPAGGGQAPPKVHQPLPTFERHEFLQHVSVMPYGVLGTSYSGGSHALAPEPDHKTAIVDATSMKGFQEGPTHGDPVSAANYKWLSISKDSEFPASVRKSLVKETDAYYQAYGKGKEKKVIHAMGVDLRKYKVTDPLNIDFSPERDLAVKEMAVAYKNIYKQFLSASVPALRMAPVGDGPLRGDFGSSNVTFARMTAEAMADGYDALSRGEKQTMQQKLVEFCCYQDKEASDYAFGIKNDQKQVGHAPSGARGGPAFDNGHYGVEINEQGWFKAENNDREQAERARKHFNLICEKVTLLHSNGRCPDGRWTNDPEVFIDLNQLLSEKGTIASGGIVPFVPHDEQFYTPGSFHNPDSCALPPTSRPGYSANQEGHSRWVRLTDFAPGDGAAFVFNDYDPAVTHFGRIRQGGLDNAYFVEALQAVALRPKLAKQLFYEHDVNKSVYIARLYKNGTWCRVEIDDYCPINQSDQSNTPICCTSEFFPHVLWPSLIEKAYAKVHTIRTESKTYDKGGWEVLGYGGRVEEAMADLTGGIAGRFDLHDVSSDRLFIYLHELQRDCLFVARVNRQNCEKNGVRLNPYHPHAVNRAAEYEGRCYVQLFCGAVGVYDGGLQDLSVPYALVHHEEFPERSHEGFFWLNINDFALYFDTVFECRLCASGDVALDGMPPPRLPMHIEANFTHQRDPAHYGRQEHHFADKPMQRYFHETVFANTSKVNMKNPPEMTIHIPEHEVPCEIVVCCEQTDERLVQTASERGVHVAMLLKVYEAVEAADGRGQRAYSTHLVCKSNWLPIRDAMVAFKATKGGEFKVMGELAGRSQCNRLIMRCFSSRPGVQIAVAPAMTRHLLVNPEEPPRAMKWSLVGCVPESRLVNLKEPEPFDEGLDQLPRQTDDEKQGCAVM